MGQSNIPIGGSRPTDERVLALEQEIKRLHALIVGLDIPIAGTGRYLIYNNTLTSEGHFDVDNIDQQYDSLEVELVGRSLYNGPRDGLGLKFNNDAGANYAGVGNNAYSNGSHSVGGGGMVMWTVGAAQTSADMWGVVQAEIPYYTGGKWKVALGRSYLRYGAAEFQDSINALTWMSTAAITRITTTSYNSANLQIGSRLRIWGWKN